MPPHGDGVRLLSRKSNAYFLAGGKVKTMWPKDGQNRASNTEMMMEYFILTASDVDVYCHESLVNVDSVMPLFQFIATEA